MSFDAFVETRAPGLLRLACALTGRRQDAEDLLQSCLTKVFVHWRRVDQADDPDAYVRAILVRTHLAEVRRRRVGHVLVDPQAHTFELDDPAQSVARHIDLDRALGRLRPRTRAVIVLRYYCDLSDDDIAAALKTSPSNVRTLLARGRRDLAVLLNDQTLLRRVAAP